MINKPKVIRRFGKQAYEYDKYAVVQKYMAKSLLKLFNNASDFKSILEIGCGTGYFTRLLAETFPKVRILATDISLGMLSVARNNLADLPNIRYSVEDGEKLKSSEKFDIIVSNAVFQWFNDYSRAFAGFYESLNDNGALLFATLGEGTFYELHTSFRAAKKALSVPDEKTMIHGQTFINIQDLHRICNDVGFDLVSHTEDFREYFPSVRTFLESVKKIGANNSVTGAIVNRRMILTMIDHYEKKFRVGNEIYTTYRIIYGVGKKCSCE